jgi:2-aminoadipate transaminase
MTAMPRLPADPGRQDGRMPSGRRWQPGIVQVAEAAGITDLGPGHLDPALLPTALLTLAYVDALADYGPAALTYGENQGPLPLRAALAARIGAADGRPCAPDQLVITAGTSTTLDLLARGVPRDGAVVLTDAVSYDLGVGIFRERGLRVRGVSMDSAGMDPGSLDGVVRAERAAGRTVAFVYLMPTFHNPTGLVVPEHRRRALLEVCRHHELTVVEDDAYTDVWFEPDAVPRSMAGLAGYRGVFRLGTFSKSLAPGLRLGWLLTDADTATAMADGAMFTSGGGLNHLAATAVSGLIETGDYDRNLDSLRTRLRARRDALVDSLRAGLPPEFTVSRPAGGFFVWVRPPAGRGEPELVAAARRAGILVADGARFGAGTGPAVRLCFSFHPPGRLSDAADRLAAAWRDA